MTGDLLLPYRKSLEEKQQENTELLSKLSAQNSELEMLQASHRELRSKLAMQELLAQQVVKWLVVKVLTDCSHDSPVPLLSFAQLQSSSPPSTPTTAHSQTSLWQERLRTAEEEVKSLTVTVLALTRERDQAASDAAALREAIMSTKQDAARKVTCARVLILQSISSQSLHIAVFQLILHVY